MKIRPFINKKERFTSWDKILSKSDTSIKVKSIITGKVKLQMHGTINVNYSKISDVPDVSFYVPVISNIIYHENYGYYLIDAGLDKSYYNNIYGVCKGTLLNEYGSKFVQEKHQNVSYYLEKENIKLKGIFLTHTHVDHISGIKDLSDNVPIYLSNKEKSMDIKPFYYADYFKNKKYLNIFDMENTIDTPILGKCIDIFNDQSVYAISTPGHTSGHISYLINGSEKYLFTGDACFTRHGIKYAIASSDYTWNIKLAQKSLEKILKFTKKYNNINLVLGHSL